ncbi:exodeoxyribonuclease VII large subunit [Chryseobacterium caseinilyticum]|uniref:Exonuclease VII large subunit C-terminal domain-containing protein n=1 Tax=Chryseobacterium caseinilyticum TaxID=2771428 RepID=A0ABR8ZDC9_9FLAO|nr:exodeoxyribonuclease VII large subunit [Chryseobacterium caseinilyticum]MBD8082858.1 hypothetical protein [Chryseobacterium caseinilyticum]
MEDQNLNHPVYSPTAIIGIFSNALKLSVTVNLIYLKGRYSYGGGKSYGNHYYDHLFSEGDNTSVGVRISALLRSKISNNDVYTLRGFIEKSIKNSSIELRFVVDEIYRQEEKSISEEELERYEVIQRKLEIGSKNLDTLIRDKILKNEKIKVANIYGNNAIVQKDFLAGLDVSLTNFDIDDHNCNITSSTAIISKLNEVSALNYDIIAIVRGGGDRQSMETFNDLVLAKLFISLKSVAVTAIGHTVDETLLDKLADKRFHLPHDYGAGLHSIVEKLSHERSNSRSLLIDEVKKDVTRQFSEKVETLEKQLKKKNDEFSEAQKTYKEQSEAHNKAYTDQLKIRNEEFEKFQSSSSKQLEDLRSNFQEQQKKRDLEMESYKKEITILHERNVHSAIHEKTASLNVSVETLKHDNAKLRQEVQNSKTNYVKIIITVIVALIIVFASAKVFK